MRNARLVPVLLVLTCICGVSMAQVAGPPQAAPARQVMPPVEPVLNHIPAGTMGFVVVNGIDNLFVKVETFYNEIGAPAGPMPPFRDMISSEMGPDFNLNGGFAAVMLDPALFDVDLINRLTGAVDAALPAPAEEGPVAAPQPAEPEPTAIPYVLFVPGLSAENLMGQDKYEVSEEEDYTVLTDPWSEEKLYAVKVGGYVLLSPNCEALEVVRSADSFFRDEVSAGQYQAIAEADVSVYVNMQVCGPLMQQFLQGLQSGAFGPMMMTPMPMQSGLMDASFASLDEQLSQIEAISVQYTFTETGLKLQMSGVFAEDSLIGQHYLSQPAIGRPLIDMLPDLPYVLAGGFHYEMNEQMKAQSLEYLSNMLNTPEVVEKFGQDVVDRMLSVADEMYSEATDMQFVIGGAPEGEGTVAAAMVFRTADAHGAMDRLPGDLPLLETALNTLITELDGEAGLTITVLQDAEIIAGVSVDHVVLDHPEIAEASEEDLQEAEAVLAMSQPTFLVAAPDEQTLIVTFGGGSAMMEQTIQTAMNGGPIADSEGVAEVMAELPGNPYMVTLLSLGNLGKVGALTELAVDPDGHVDWPLEGMEVTKPIVFGAAAEGATVHVVLFAPNDVIADAVSAVMAAQQAAYQQMMQPPPGQAPPGWEDTDEQPAEPYDEGF